MSIVKKIEQNLESYNKGDQHYIPHPKELGEFSKWFPGRMRSDITAITAGTSASKTTLTKFLVFKAIEWAIENNKSYHCCWFGLEELEDSFNYSLLSFLIYQKSNKQVRYTIEHFEGIGKSIDLKHLQSIKDIEPLYEKYRSYITFYETVANSYGIYKTIRDFARKRGEFFFEEKKLTQEQLDTGVQWDKYIPTNKEEFVEIVVDHLGELHIQKDEKDLRDAMINLVKKLRMYVAKVFKYSIVVVHQQMLEMENLEHVKENFVLASIQGLGDSKTVGRAYTNIIGLTNINRYGLNVANTDTGSFNIGQLGDYQRIISILKRRFGVTNKKAFLYHDPCGCWFEQMPKQNSPEYMKVIEQIKTFK